MFIQHLKVCHRYCMVWKQNFLLEVVKIFSQINISVIFTHAFKIKSFTNICMWIITQIKGMLVLISSLKLSTVPFAADPES